MRIIKYGEYYNSSEIDLISFNGIEKVGESAFANSSISKAIGTIRNVGNFAFSVCENLQGTIQVDGEKIGRAAFERCPLIEDVIIGNNVRQIDGWTFDECQQLKKVSFPHLLQNIGEEAFHRTGLTELTIGSVDTIESRAFYECDQLHTVNIGKINQSIKSNAFSECPNLKTIIYNGKTLMNLSQNEHFVGIYRNSDGQFIIKYEETIIGENSNTQKIQHEILIPTELPIVYGSENEEQPLDSNSILRNGILISSDRIIPNRMYRDCRTITCAILDNVEQIGNGAFDKCSNLVSVSLPASLITIGDSAFQDSGIEAVDLSHTRNYNYFWKNFSCL